VVDEGSGTFAFVAYGGNGNVMGLVNATDGTISARYEYGPFGEPLRASGHQAANPFRFSTKYCDTESGLYYYGYRYNDPSTGRWLSRDPIGEEGGIALYTCVDNDILARSDYLGLQDQEAANPELMEEIAIEFLEKNIDWVSSFAASVVEGIRPHCVARGGIVFSGPLFLAKLPTTRIVAAVGIELVPLHRVLAELVSTGFVSGKVVFTPVWECCCYTYDDKAILREAKFGFKDATFKGTVAIVVYPSPDKEVTLHSRESTVDLPLPTLTMPMETCPRSQ